MDSVDNTLSFEIEKSTKKILETFRYYSVSGLSELEGHQMLKEVSEYWSDTFRPALAGLCCQSVGGKPEQTEDVMVIISLLSAGLGVHDDIIDKSANKHLRYTLLGLHGQEKALLAGNFLIVKAFTYLQELLKKGHPIEKTQRIISEIDQFFVEVWEGELIEISCRKNLQTSLQSYQKCLWLSTADTEAAAKIGAILGNARTKEVVALSDFGRRIGLIYRFAGEISDTLGIEGNLLERLENESVPLPVLWAAKKSKQNYQKISKMLANSPIELSDASGILDCVFKAKTIELTLDSASKHADKASEDLSSLETSEARKKLGILLTQALENINELLP